MKHLPRILTLVLVAACTPPATRSLPLPATSADAARWQQHTRNVTITRDDWGIAHVRGRTDADAVFGMMYAQAEDDFPRIETNYLNAMGMLALAEGEAAVFQDLRMKLFIEPDALRAEYAASPAWLQQLMTAWADGLNFYLASNPGVRPRVIRHFEPWMALSFSEGSIGGDIESISTRALAAFHGAHERTGAGVRPAGGSGDGPADPVRWEPGGSNGFAIAPSNTIGGNALLLINPHTSFFFRAEQQVTSEEGLNVYGASTWGQFFVYQGFNERLGWMHTSSGVDAIDEFAETVVERAGRRFYRYGAEERPLVEKQVDVPYRTPDGAVATRSFTTYRTHRGPIVREADGKWVSVALMHKPRAALTQSYARTKARNFGEYMQAMSHRANSSNNTIYADADGVIAYLHPQFVPRRDDRFNYQRPVDGSDPATDWKGEHALDELPFVRNPSTGWIQNTNDWPYSAAGTDSPRRERFPAYMDAAGENARGVHAIMVLDGKQDFTLESLRAAAYDSYQPAFATMIPALVRAYDSLPAGDAMRARVAPQMAMLRGWDYRWGTTSIPTSLAIYWAETIADGLGDGWYGWSLAAFNYIATRTTAAQRLEALAAASDRLTRDFGTWRTPWGEINRFQRITGDIAHPFSDAAPSIPVGFTSARWGSLASFGAGTYRGSKRRYGTSGNSFVAVVEFGDSVRARAVTAGGESGNPASPHFNDQAARYASGDLRPVYFYPADIAAHAESTYRPGEAPRRP